MDPIPLNGDEIVLRRIPPGDEWFQPPTISTFNFGLRDGENGVSVYRQNIISPAELLAKPEAKPGSLVAAATVNAIRNAVSGNGEKLRLDVVAVDDEDNPGHAEIRGPIIGKMSGAAKKALRSIFQITSDSP